MQDYLFKLGNRKWSDRKERAQMEIHSSAHTEDRLWSPHARDNPLRPAEAHSPDEEEHPTQHHEQENEEHDLLRQKLNEIAEPPFLDYIHRKHLSKRVIFCYTHFFGISRAPNAVKFFCATLNLTVFFNNPIVVILCCIH